eukprot:m.116412 g.116412  ORF g.116412 m.116412 type:complete len:312 (-) comp19436_c3_seq3:41-976(-)
MKKDTVRKSKALANVDPKLAEIILNELIEEKPSVSFDDVVGQDAAKDILRQIVVWPSLRPDLFQGLRTPARGVLLFGPPGNGKTMLAKALAHEAKAKFFSISCSSLTSKYVGEGEKLVRALFALARELQPSIVFIDEIDSLLSPRNAGEHDASRRLKTEFLVQFDGVSTGDNTERVLILGATNLPMEIDTAALRRLEKRVYLPLPGPEARESLIRKLMCTVPSDISASDMRHIVRQTENYSGSDLAALCKEAAYGPIKELGDRLKDIPKNTVRKVNGDDFRQALGQIKSSVRVSDLKALEDWNKEFGVTLT